MIAPKRREKLLALLAGALAAGCFPAPSTQRAGTGAEAVVKDYCEAILRQDWGRAHAHLAPDEQAACGPVHFARLAAGYRAGMGFEPKTVHVRSCEEKVDTAVAHVVFMGAVGSEHRSYQDGFALRRTAAGWCVVQPARLIKS
jgi:hypothetical protein